MGSAEHGHQSWIGSTTVLAAREEAAIGGTHMITILTGHAGALTTMLVVQMVAIAAVVMACKPRPFVVA
jgi:hypothetical protein